MRDVNQKRYQDAQDKGNREAVNVAAIVRVTAFNPDKMTVDVQPISQYLEGGAYQSQPPILGVPVAHTRSGGFIIRPWIKEHDVGLVVYVDHDIDKAVAEGKECQPNTERNHSTSDAVYIGGIATGNAPAPSLPKDAAIIATDDGGTYIAIKPGHIEIVGNVTISGSVEASGEVKAGSISLSAHTHSGVETGSGSTGQPQ